MTTPTPSHVPANQTGPIITDAMVKAYMRIPLGAPDTDRRKINRWINAVWKNSHKLRRAKGANGSSKPTHTAKRDALKFFRRMYDRAAIATKASHE